MKPSFPAKTLGKSYNKLLSVPLNLVLQASKVSGVRPSLWRSVSSPRPIVEEDDRYNVHGSYLIVFASTHHVIGPY